MPINIKLNFSKKVLQDAILTNVNAALKEDLGRIDKTSQLISKNELGIATIKSNQSAILCGSLWVNSCFKKLNNRIKIDWLVSEGQSIKKGQTICQIQGRYIDILAGERVALNFLQTLSATATETNTMVRLIKKYSPKIFDTRKTIPGLRIAQKYAVRIGGGENQRLGLYDQTLIKENHIKSFVNLSDLLNKAKLDNEFDKIQIEVENLSQLKKVLSYGIKNILLDNFNTSKIKEAIKINKNRAILEASGNINRKNIINFVKTGVPRISVGFITKNIHSIDFSMKIDRN